jgi:hypothetical protein
MSKSEWVAIAKALAAQRAIVLASWPPKDLTNANALHDYKLRYLSQLSLIDSLATHLAATLDNLISNFDPHHFLRLVGVVN